MTIQEQGLLSRSSYLIKERFEAFKLADTYDILDPDSEQKVGFAREEPAAWVKFSPWLKTRLPTVVNIYEMEGHPPLLSINRGFWFLAPTFRVVTGDGQTLGTFRNTLSIKYLSNMGLEVLDADGRKAGELGLAEEGGNKLTDIGWEALRMHDQTVGTIRRDLAAMGKEILTGVYSCKIALNEGARVNPSERAMLLACGVVEDMLWKVRKRS